MWDLGMQWHQLDHIQTICTSFQTDNHTNTSSLQAGYSSGRPANGVKAPMADEDTQMSQSTHQARRQGVRWVRTHPRMSKM